MKLATLLLSATLCWGQAVTAATGRRALIILPEKNDAPDGYFLQIGPIVPCPLNGAEETCIQAFWGPDIHKLAGLLMKYEGHPSGGLKYVNQKGAHADASGYAQWQTPELSRAGLERDLARNFARGETVGEIVNSWGGRGKRVPYAERLLKEMR